MDLTGDLPKSIDGYHYMTIDEATDFVRVTFLKTKCQAVDAVLKMVKWFERKLVKENIKVQCIKTHNAKELTCKTVSGFCAEHQIDHNKSPPYCPRQNGRVERQMRRIKDLVVTVLSHSSLDRRFWKEASSFVVYVLNRTVNAKDPNPLRAIL